MPDWTQPMTRTYEFYEVDPGTWKDMRIIRTVKTATVSRDLEADTLGSATIDVTNLVGECYVRVYLITIQNGVRERHPLGTFLVQTPSSTFDGRVRSSTMDAYTPLLELKENPPPLGYSLMEDTNIMEMAYRLVREHARAPVVKTDSSETLQYDFVANTSDTWLTFIKDLIANVKYELALDEMGRILFAPKQELESLQPVFTYDDGNSSILQPETTTTHDIYGIPNVVEVVYSNGNRFYTARVVNDDLNSPVSTVARGREILHRETNPSVSGYPTEGYIKQYAERLLKELSSVQYTVTYTHGYNGTRLGDCVRLNYKRAELNGVNAKIISQNIKCDAGCQVTEKAVFTKKLWG